jgi:AhpC/TSA antioxidant enzyme
LDRAHREFEAAGVELVLIGQATPRDAAQFRRRQRIGLPVLADEKRVSYKAIGAKVGGVSDLLGPSVMAKGALNTLKNHAVQTRTIGHPAQLGAAAVIVPGGEIVWRHIAEDAADNAAPAEILRAAAALGAR